MKAPTPYTLEYRDREGRPISLDDWTKLFENSDYKIVERDVVDDKVISTVWLGSPHMGAGEKGMGAYFETMVFSNDWSFEDEYCERYETLGEAVEGHKRIKQRIENGDDLAS